MIVFLFEPSLVMSPYQNAAFCIQYTKHIGEPGGSPNVSHLFFCASALEKLSRAARTAAAVLFELQFTLSQAESFLLQKP